MTPRPIFIVGSGRSGTSVLTWAIGQHPNIIVTPETNWLTALASYLEAFHDIGMAPAPTGHLSRWNISKQQFLLEFGLAVDGIILRTFEARFPDRQKSLGKAMEQKGLAWFRSLDDPKTRWVDGTPSSTGYAGVLGRMFPKARFINLVRDPVKVVQSWMGASFRHADLAEARELVAHVYHSQKAGYLTHGAFSDRTKRVIMEDLTADPEGVMRGIMEFLGEDYSPDCVKPLAEKINSSGEVKSAVLAEFAGIADFKPMAEMVSWYRSAQDENWRLESDSRAAEGALADYARYKIPIPVSR